MKSKAFTLIELLIVVAIIGILAAIAVPNFMNARIKAAVSRVEADMKATTTALEMYRLDYGKYVKTMAGASDIVQLTTPIPYLASMPKDYFQGNDDPKTFNPDSQTNSWEYTSNSLGWGWKPPHAYMVSSVGPAKTGHGPHLDWAYTGPNNWNKQYFRDVMYNISNGILSAGAIIKYGGDVSPLN
ncbi:MAG TPA: prepilin-type N-terminal cleavage/methylation domain-containing protein [bacterium]|nr:prepilin-type N-terminal cleavage/methylation domain-containing protein [bacterium]